ncbi:hypothetical protein DB31_3823 [Hyalangium minutum]|uniref:Uncharacterized protein n=1 Tax=Hyalangium minutum TaxID=394096 RepID=A0A085W4U6_9BACT|nr:hypothetical protein DB31_3823 [Hyalangium minutum]
MPPHLRDEGGASLSVLFHQNFVQVAPARGELLEGELEPLADHPLVRALLDREFVERRLQLPLRDGEMLLRLDDAPLQLRSVLQWNGSRPRTSRSVRGQSRDEPRLGYSPLPHPSRIRRPPRSLQCLG